MQLTVDGKTVFAATGGRDFDPRQPAVLLLHGAGLDHVVWALPARSLAHRGRAVLAPDLPGHGRSQGPALASIGELAGWVLRLLDATGIKQAALVGHSMGALVALETAAAAPPRVRALALLGVAGRMPVHPDLMQAAASDRPHAADLIVSWGHGPAGHFGGNPAPGVWLMGGGQQLLAKAGEGVLAADLSACNAYDAMAAAPRVTCPTLLLLGGCDRMTPPGKAKALAAALSQAEAVVLPDSGHMMMGEAPDAVIDQLLRFV